MNIRSRFYIDFAERIKDIAIDNVLQIKHIDLWNNQLQHIKEEEQFAFPAVFLEFMPIKWEALGGKRQQANIVINVHIVSNNKVRTNQKSNSASTGLLHLELIDAVHKQLQGWCGEYFGSLNRVSSEHDHDHDYLWAHVESYSLRITDDAGKNEVTGVTIKFAHDVQLINTNPA